MKRIIRLLLTLIIFFALGVDAVFAAGLNMCGTGGAIFGVSTACSASCSGTQIDVSSLQPLVPPQNRDQFNNLCGDATQKCCAARGDALCSKAAERAGLSGSCKSSCGTTEASINTALSGLPSGMNFCSDGSVCCVPSGSAVNVQPLTGSGAQALQKGVAASPNVAAAAPTPGYGLINPLGSRSIPTLVADLIRWISGLAGTVFMVFLLWGGVEWMTAGGDGKKVVAARSRILYSILGIVVIFLAYFIVDTLIGITNLPF